MLSGYLDQNLNLPVKNSTNREIDDMLFASLSYSLFFSYAKGGGVIL